MLEVLTTGCSVVSTYVEVPFYLLFFCFVFLCGWSSSPLPVSICGIAAKPGGSRGQTQKADIQEANEEVFQSRANLPKSMVKVRFRNKSSTVLYNVHVEKKL